MIFAIIISGFLRFQTDHDRKINTRGLHA